MKPGRHCHDRTNPNRNGVFARWFGTTAELRIPGGGKCYVKRENLVPFRKPRVYPQVRRSKKELQRLAVACGLSYRQAVEAMEEEC